MWTGPNKSLIILDISQFTNINSKLSIPTIQIEVTKENLEMDTIWTFEENQAVETEKVDMKPFKPTGRFFEDVQTLVRMFGIKTHPALRENSYRTELPGNASIAQES